MFTIFWFVVGIGPEVTPDMSDGTDAEATSFVSPEKLLAKLNRWVNAVGVFDSSKL